MCDGEYKEKDLELRKQELDLPEKGATENDNSTNAGNGSNECCFYAAATTTECCSLWTH